MMFSTTTLTGIVFCNWTAFYFLEAAELFLSTVFDVFGICARQMRLKRRWKWNMMVIFGKMVEFTAFD